MSTIKGVVIPALVASTAIALAPHASAHASDFLAAVRADAVLPLTPPSFNSNEQAFLRELRHD